MNSLLGALLAGALAASAAEAPPIPGRLDLPSDVASPAAAPAPAASDAAGLSRALLGGAPEARMAAAAVWCASLEATAKGAEPAVLWAAIDGGAATLEEILRQDDSPALRRWLFYRLFACTTAVGRDAVLARPRNGFWIEPWLRLEQVRDRASGDGDASLRQYMERYEPSLPEPDWRGVRKHAAGVLRRVASSYRGSKGELKDAWRRCAGIERAEAASLRAELKAARADRRLTRRERKALQANLQALHGHKMAVLWGNVFLRGFTSSMSPQAAMTYGAILRPVTLGWPDLRGLYARGHAERGLRLAAAGRPEEAAAELLRALSLDPSLKEAGIVLRALQAPESN